MRSTLLKKTWTGCTLYMALLAFLVLTNTPASAQEEAQKPTFAYIALEPDIVTNYVSDNSKKLRYLRITIELMLDDPTVIPDVEHHMPLLRATAIEIIGGQTDDQVRSLTGREELRRAILKSFRDILMREIEKEAVRDIIFTKYLRQGG